MSRRSWSTLLRSKALRGLVAAAVVALASLPAGCGYRFSPGGENINPAIRLVFVDSFENRTPEPYLEIYFRNAFSDQFRRTSRFRLADSRGAADADLRGSVNALSLSPLSYTRADFATEERATVTVSLVFQDRNKEIIWRNDSFSGYQDYRIDQGNTTATEQLRRAALQKLANDMAERAFRSLMSGF